VFVGDLCLEEANVLFRSIVRKCRATEKTHRLYAFRHQRLKIREDSALNRLCFSSPAIKNREDSALNRFDLETSSRSTTTTATTATTADDGR